MTDAVKPLGFKLEQRGGTWILVYDSGGCHPATDEEIALWNHRTPPAGWKPIERVPPAHKFLMERCWYWVPVVDDKSLPPDGWKGVVEAETKRGHIEYRQAEYRKPLFGGKPEWSAWTFREEGDWKPLRWLKKWDIQLLSAAPENDDE